jgi:hypothetical protein
VTTEEQAGEWVPFFSVLARAYQREHGSLEGFVEEAVDRMRSADVELDTIELFTNALRRAKDLVEHGVS